MKVYLDPGPGLGMAIWRVARALKDYAPPWVEVVQEIAQADLQVVHALGDGERRPLLDGLAAGTQMPYAVFQLCLRTTESPNTADWLGVWAHAKLVASYYHLPNLCMEDGTVFTAHDRFMYTPLGVDAAFANHERLEFAAGPIYTVGTSGYIASTEGVSEWNAVIEKLDRFGFHLGPTLPECTAPGWRFGQGMTDRVVAGQWNRCKYVAAMRRIEGFEFPGIEGLVCGARPVCFDRPHYRQWYESAAEYVPESSPAEVIESLLAMVEKPYRAVTAGEIAWARARFDWPKIVGEFWNRLEGTV